MNVWYPLISVIIVSLISLVGVLPFLLHKEVNKQVLIFLLSMSVGVLLATVFMDFLPEVFSHTYTLGTVLWILGGFVVMFVLEKFVHWHHSKKCESHEHVGHGHAYSIAPINIIGDGIHNFLDGLVIAASYAANVGLGISATIAIIFHEIPQEIADMGVLLYAGLSKTRAILYNLLSAFAAIIGTLIGVWLIGTTGWLTGSILPFAAGNFIYIAAANLTPQLHRHCGLKDAILHVFAMCLGVALIALLVVYGPAHGH